MPPWTSVTGRFALRAASGVNTPRALTASASIGRPSGVVPNWKHFTCFGYACWKAPHSLTTSS